MSRRKKHLEAQIDTFLDQYRCKKTPEHTNDRDYSRKIEAIVKRMKPRELDEIMRGEYRDDKDSEAS